MDLCCGDARCAPALCGDSSSELPKKRPCGDAWDLWIADAGRMTDQLSIRCGVLHGGLACTRLRGPAVSGRALYGKRGACAPRVVLCWTSPPFGELTGQASR